MPALDMATPGRQMNIVGGTTDAIFPLNVGLMFVRQYRAGGFRDGPGPFDRRAGCRRGRQFRPHRGDRPGAGAQVEGGVRALAKVVNAEPGQFAWTRVPVDFPSNLLVIPTSEIRALDASEDQEIWGVTFPNQRFRWTLQRRSPVTGRSLREEMR
jgi:hypothetical protein